MHRTSTKTLLIVLILLIIVAAAGYGFILWRVLNESQRVAVFIEELAREVDREAQLRSLGNLVEEVAADQTIIDSQFVAPGEDAVVAYITMIESLADDMPVIINIMSVEKAGTVTDGTGEVHIRVSASGSEEAVTRFVELLELLPVMTLVNVAQLNVSQGTQWDIVLHIQAFIRTPDEV